MPSNETRVAILAGGCFWCLEAVFEQMRGVTKVESGYCGGRLANPGYRDVCNGTTGHAEAVRISFDAERIRYRDLLEVFFVIHDPTTPNRQGNDVGTQYRSAIFYLDEAQKQEAEALISELAAAGAYPAAIVTELLPAAEFYVAEPEHQGYYRAHENQPYCAYVVAPKLQKFREKFAALRV